MALFLPMIMVISGFTAGGPFHYQEQAGVLGGLTSATEVSYSGNGQAVLVAQPTPNQGNAPVESDITYMSGIMESGLLLGASETASMGGPDGRPPGGVSGRQNGTTENYFAMPAKGFNWKKLHPNNAVDIANACGTDIIAAAEGLVSETSVNSWNDGYGNYIMLSHSNDTKTRYAHLQKVLVSVGQYVKKGELIGKMGDTGNSTGCHVHFEIYGADNPFAK